MPSNAQPTDQAGASGARTGPADRRLGERRFELVETEGERRGNQERRQTIGRRESASGHIRNAVQMLDGALADAENGTAVLATDTLLAILERMRLALREADRITTERDQLGQLVRVTRRGLPPDHVVGLPNWLV
jgi:hypothetical protein